MRKQAAITLRCMQALVRVQARVRARRVRLALESQTTEQRLQQQLANEAHVKEIEVSNSSYFLYALITQMITLHSDGITIFVS